LKDDRLYLLHMLERCQRISRYIEPGRATFMRSEELQDAVIRNIEVIGGAAKRVTSEVMRDVLIHDYIGVDLELEKFLAVELPGAAPIL
jgi:uncharacterized protein with HEPN domain